VLVERFQGTNELVKINPSDIPPVTLSTNALIWRVYVDNIVLGDFV
jgi:hypothetical protein